MIEWILDNLNWIFSGIGVFVLSLLLLLFKRKKGRGNVMKQKAGNNSTNIQIGGDYNGR